MPHIFYKKVKPLFSVETVMVMKKWWCWSWCGHVHGGGHGHRLVIAMKWSWLWCMVVVMAIAVVKILVVVVVVWWWWSFCLLIVNVVQVVGRRYGDWSSLWLVIIVVSHYSGISSQWYIIVVVDDRGELVVMVVEAQKFFLKNVNAQTKIKTQLESVKNLKSNDVVLRFSIKETRFRGVLFSCKSLLTPFLKKLVNFQ